MKHWLLAVSLICFGSLAHASEYGPPLPLEDRAPVLIADASTVAPAPAAPIAADINAAAGAVQTAKSLPSGPLRGKLDFNVPPTLGAWQSFTSADQAVGASEPAWHLEKGGQDLLNLGVAAAIKVHDVNGAGVPVASFFLGETIQVPGSVIDWALGTKMGDTWVPRLKTGFLVAYDMWHLKEVAQKNGAPSFVGGGISYPWIAQWLGTSSPNTP